MTSIEQRREIVFLYSARDTNPNGDPDDENRPRTDDDGHVLVSDVRLKRTIRDYFLATDEGEVLIQKKLTDEGGIMNIEDHIREALDGKLKNDASDRQVIETAIPERFLDIRLFGLTAAVEKAQTSITGPVQFAIGHSLNIPKISTHTITSTMSAAKATGGAMGTFHILDFALIAFEGVVCPYLAEKSQMSLEDLQLLYKGMWKGTETLLSRSKINHVPKLLLAVVSNSKDFIVGELAYTLKMAADAKKDMVEFDAFVAALKPYKDRIKTIEYAIDPSLKCICGGKEKTFKTLCQEDLEGFQVKTIEIEV